MSITKSERQLFPHVASDDIVASTSLPTEPSSATFKAGSERSRMGSEPGSFRAGLAQNRISHLRGRMSWPAAGHLRFRIHVSRRSPGGKC